MNSRPVVDQALLHPVNFAHGDATGRDNDISGLKAFIEGIFGIGVDVLGDAEIDDGVGVVLCRLEEHSSI